MIALRVRAKTVREERIGDSCKMIDNKLFKDKVIVKG